MKTINLGIGFATGRKSFKKVITSYINTWNETKKDLPPDIDVRLSLFVAYDVKYQNAQSTDFTNLKQEIIDAFDNIVFIGAKNMSRQLEQMSQSNILSPSELKCVFGNSYAGNRNSVLYSAIEYHMDYLLFLDDDEYPMAVTNSRDECLWSGQQVFLTHLKGIADADYTNGYHCGYVSPVPKIAFNDVLSESDFHMFINAISNEIISWDNILNLMSTDGITYSSVDLLENPKVIEVPLVNGCRFISGANLCINLKDPERSLPFYNPPGARGEDTFLSATLRDRKVYKVPCYTFHDGFSFYQNLLEGALPIHLNPITCDSKKITDRFFNACIGWIRYKPLYVYITQPDDFEEIMKKTRVELFQTAPALANYFQDARFLKISDEFEKYYRNAPGHYKKFILAQDTWNRILKESDF